MLLALLPLPAAATAQNIEPKNKQADDSRTVAAADDPLLLAARGRDGDTVAKLLAQGGDVNTRDKAGRTALYYAVANSDMPLIETLLRRGADVNALSLFENGDYLAVGGTGDSNRSILDKAIDTGRSEVVTAIVSAGADLARPSRSRRCPGAPLAAGIVTEATIYGNLGLVRFILDRYPLQKIAEHKHGVRAVNDLMAVAARTGRRDLLQLLHERGAPLNPPPGSEAGALEVALLNREHHHLLPLLLGWGAQWRTVSSGAIIVAWKRAVALRDMRLLELLKKNGLPSRESLADADGRVGDWPDEFMQVGDPALLRRWARRGFAYHAPPLINAIARGDAAEVRALIAADPAVALGSAKDSATPLHAAAFLGDTVIMTLLLEAGADAAAVTSGEPDHKDETPLHWAAAGNSLAAARLLLERLPTRETRRAAVNARGACGQTPLYGAAERGSAELMEMLLAEGADFTLAVRSTFGGIAPGSTLPLHLAARNGNYNAARVLLQHGASAILRNPQFDTPLHLAARAGEPRTVALLLKHGADPNAMGQNTTPLWTAVRSRAQREPAFNRQPGEYFPAADGRPITDGRPVAALLLAAGADINVMAANGESALQCAAREGDYAMAVWLLQHGADANRRPPAQLGSPMPVPRSPLHEAVRRDDVAMVRLLLRYGAAVQVEDSEGRTPLDYAEGRGHYTGLPIDFAYAPQSRRWSQSATPATYLRDPASRLTMVALLGAAGARPGSGPLLMAVHHRAPAAARAVLQAWPVGLRPVLARASSSYWALHPVSRPPTGGGFHVLQPPPPERVLIYTEARDNDQSALREAIDLNAPAVVELLLENGALTGNAADAAPLLRAIELGYTPIVRLLLRHGAPANGYVVRGFTPMWLAQRRNDPELLGLLVYHGADTKVLSPDHYFYSAGEITGQAGTTTPDPAAWFRRVATYLGRGDFDTARYSIMSQPAVARARDKNGESLVGFALRYSLYEIALDLIERGADVNAAPQDGLPPIYSALTQPELLRALLDAGADPNYDPDLGPPRFYDAAGTRPLPRTLTGRPLYAAIAAGREDAVRLLLDHGARATLPDANGVTPLQWALANQQPAIANLLSGVRRAP